MWGLPENEQKNLELFNKTFGFDLTRLPDAEERFFLSETVRSHMTMLLNQANGPVHEAAALLMKEPPRNRDEAMKLIHRRTDLRKEAEELQVAFYHAEELLRSLGFKVHAWALNTDPFPTIESLAKKPTNPTPPTP